MVAARPEPTWPATILQTHGAVQRYAFPTIPQRIYWIFLVVFHTKSAQSRVQNQSNAIGNRLHSSRFACNQPIYLSIFLFSLFRLINVFFSFCCDFTAPEAAESYNEPFAHAQGTQRSAQKSRRQLRRGSGGQSWGISPSTRTGEPFIFSYNIFNQKQQKKHDPTLTLGTHHAHHHIPVQPKWHTTTILIYLSLSFAFFLIIVN